MPVVRCINILIGLGQISDDQNLYFYLTEFTPFYGLGKRQLTTNGHYPNMELSLFFRNVSINVGNRCWIPAFAGIQCIVANYDLP
jgi:hypothetical protein